MNDTHTTPGEMEIESDGTTIALGGQCCIVAPAPDYADYETQKANAAAIVAGWNNTTAKGIDPAALPDLVAALRGTADMLREAARMHRLKGDIGHARNCETHEKNARTALDQATK